MFARGSRQATVVGNDCFVADAGAPLWGPTLSLIVQTKRVV